MTIASLARRAWIESAWAERLVYADSLNEERLAGWESRRALILEADIPVSVAKRLAMKPSHGQMTTPANVSPIRKASLR